MAVFLKRSGYRPDQVQDFIPAPFDVATAMYYTGLDPFTRKPVYVARHLRDRKLQRALLQFFAPANYFDVRKALEKAGRQDLIGSGCDCLIPDKPPKEAIQQRRERANRGVRRQPAPQRSGGKKKGKGKRQSRNQPGQGYRPGRSSLEG